MLISSMVVHRIRRIHRLFLLPRMTGRDTAASIQMGIPEQQSHALPKLEIDKMVAG